MDLIYLIKALHRQGLTTREIAAQLKINRESVLKYIKQAVLIPSPIKRERKTPIDPYLPHIHDLLRSDQAIASPKHRVTAQRIHALIVSGELTKELPALAVSIRTVERAVKELRGHIKNTVQNRYLKLHHQPGEAQLDFGEVEMFHDGYEERHFILVMSFPFSNFRLAQVLPAQNFECLAFGLQQIFAVIGRIPNTIRCDNMSTAVAKIIRRENLTQGECNIDPRDHPRKITQNFKALIAHYGFQPEFCNPAAGNEKGSVENAVGWVRRNFFCPLRRFNGDYAALNEKLTRFCLQQAQKLHYRQQTKTISQLFAQDCAVMLAPPVQPFSAWTWSQRKVSKTCRVVFETNEYQLNVNPGTTVLIKKSWNELVFLTEQGLELGHYQRCYDKRKDNIDWEQELARVTEKPSAFNNSLLSRIAPQEVTNYLREQTAPKRKLLLHALHQEYEKSRDLHRELLHLQASIVNNGRSNVEAVAAGYRGYGQTPPDEVQPLPLGTAFIGSDASLATHREQVSRLFGGAHV